MDEFKEVVEVLKCLYYFDIGLEVFYMIYNLFVIELEVIYDGVMFVEFVMKV